MKRSPLRRKTPLKSSGPIKPKPSQKRPRRLSRGKMPEAVQQAVTARSGGRCEARIAPGCTGNGEHFHHRMLRAQGGANTVANLVDLCHACHGWVHANVSWAQRHSWIVPSWASPERRRPIKGHQRDCDCEVGLA